MKCTNYIVLMCLIAMQLVYPAVVADGTFNSLFGNNGFVFAPSQVGGNLVMDVKIQPDGKIVTLATFDATRILRYLKDGALDTSFANTGQADITDIIDFGSDILIRPDGKLIITGSNDVGTRFAFTRYHPNGERDLTFGTNGLAEYAVGGLEASALQRDEKIVAVGFHTTNAVILCLLPNGDLDPSFPTITTTYAAQVAGATAAHIYDVCIQDDQKIVVGGSVTIAGLLHFFLARYLPNGQLDTTFGNQGVSVTQVTPGQVSIVLGVQVTHDGSIIVAGLANDNADFFLARYTSQGYLDAGFGIGGFQVTSFVLTAGGLRASKPLVQADGKLVAFVRNASEVTVFRSTSDGSLDRSFGNSGSITLLQYAECRASAINEDGEIFMGAQEDSVVPRATLISLRVDSVRYSQLAQLLWRRYYNTIL